MQPYDSVLFERICRCLALGGSWFPWNPSISFLYLGVEWGRSRRSVEMSLIRRLNWQWAVHWNHDSSAVLSVYSITPPHFISYCFSCAALGADPVPPMLPDHPEFLMHISVPFPAGALLPLRGLCCSSSPPQSSSDVEQSLQWGSSAQR